jgi:hypothetical protein
VIADADGDGNRDLVVLHDAAGGLSPSGTVGVVRQTAPGAFAAEQLFADDDTTTSYDARALAVGDYDGDAANDVLVATSFGMTILLQNTDALPHLGAPWIVDSNPAHMDTDVSAPFFDVTLGRDATNVNDTTVQLLDARGESAGAHATYDGNTRTVRVTPPGGLANGAYTVHLSGLTDPSGSMLADDDVAFTVGPPPDETAPQTILHAPPSGYRSTASATLAFTSNESATFSCSLDNAPYAPCTSPVKVSTAAGGHVFRVFARDGAGNEDATPATANWTYRVAVHGYWMVGSGGAVYAFGNAPNYGSAPTSSVVDLEVSPSGYGYWVVDAAGRVYAYGDAHAYGNAPGLAAGDRVTSISRSATGKGYWLFTARGRVYTFGDARFYGDMRAVPLNGPVLDSVATPSGRGYYMVASDGGVFSFGDARFYGSTGGMRLNSPVRSLVPDGDGTGYWLVAIDGGVFAFRAPFRGSMGGVHLNRPVVGMVAFGNGYLMVGSDGGIFNFSNKPFLGSLGDRPPAAPIVSVAAFG